MDAFEKARHKHALHKAQRERSAAKKEEPLPYAIDPGDPVAVEPPKQKATDAVIAVTVTLPDKSYSFTLTKQAVYSNAVPTKLTQLGFTNGIRDGLRPLLGELK